MYTVGDFYDALDSFAPFSTAESWDNTGILIGDRDLPVTRALVALDLTGPVLEEALKMEAELVITHHPVIFRPLKALSVRSIPYRAVATGISVISAHTNLDCAAGGVNDQLALRLGLGDVEPFAALSGQPWCKVVVFVPVDRVEGVCAAMAEAGAGRLGNYSHCGFQVDGTGSFRPLEGANPAVGTVGEISTVAEARLEMVCPPAALDGVLGAMRAAHPYEEPAFDLLHNHALTESAWLGRVGGLDRPHTPEELAGIVKERLGAPGVRYVPGGREITRVAVVGGSGGEYLHDALAAGAQALVTSEIKHHLLLEAPALGITLVDAGHFHTENVVVSPLRDRLKQLLPEAEIDASARCADGVETL